MLKQGMYHPKKLQQQQGAVMATVLMLLVVITLLGLSSMREGMLQARMSSSEIAYNSCFTAAESGLNAVYREFQEEVSSGVGIANKNNFINRASAVAVTHCLGDTGTELMSGSSCSAGKLSEYAELSVTMQSRPADPNNKAEKDHVTHFNTDVDRGGFMLIYTDSRCQMDGVDLAVVNTQAWQHRASNSLPRLKYTN